jgi:anti-sigma factor RsiW
MSSQHLSDEAIAAFADGVLSGHARERAMRHTRHCAECARAVVVQREAMWALRAAPAPALPNGLIDKLRGLPQTTPITPRLPTVMAPDGTAMLSVMSPVAALVPSEKSRKIRKAPALGAAAALAAVGMLVAGSTSDVVAGNPSSPTHAGGHHLRHDPSLVTFRGPR